MIKKKITKGVRDAGKDLQSPSSPKKLKEISGVALNERKQIIKLKRMLDKKKKS
jgi:hypothetical protein